MFQVTKIALLACWIILSAVSYSLAGDSKHKGELFAILGMSSLHNDESYLGTGIDFGGGLGFRFSDRIGVELEVDRVGFARDFSSGVRFEGSATVLGGNLQFYFPHSNVEPYVFGGAGVIRFSETDTFPAIGVFDLTQNSPTLQFGGGVRFFIAPRMSLRPEFRWSWNEISFIHQIRGSVSVGYHW